MGAFYLRVILQIKLPHCFFKTRTLLIVKYLFIWNKEASWWCLFFLINMSPFPIAPDQVMPARSQCSEILEYLICMNLNNSIWSLISSSYIKSWGKKLFVAFFPPTNPDYSMPSGLLQIKIILERSEFIFSCMSIMTNDSYKPFISVLHNEEKLHNIKFLEVLWPNIPSIIFPLIALA